MNPNPFRYFNSSPAGSGWWKMYVCYPLSLRNIEDLLAERGIDVSYETVRYWWISGHALPVRFRTLEAPCFPCTGRLPWRLG